VSAFDALSLGNEGHITLQFDPPIVDGQGDDFAVFENSFSATFLELGFVEVSSNGTDFARFDSAYLGTSPIASFGIQNSTNFDGLAGKYAQGYGQPFDLASLRYHLGVQFDSVDLQNIRFVRIVDIVGDGRSTDSFGHPIYDPHPTVQTAGFDLDAVGVLHQAP
jgi:hypothetical protein